MATTLANLRAKLNGEIGVTTDGESAPWSTTERNNAISDGFAELWRKGVWKPAKTTTSTVADQRIYTTTLRRLNRAEVLDSSGFVASRPKVILEPDGAGSYQLVVSTLPAGYTLAVYGWTAYKSQFSSDSDTDDLDAEYNRIPLLKAKAILYRKMLGKFARYGERQALPPEMNLTVDQALGIIAASEREFEDACRDLANQRVRVGHVTKVPL